MGLSRRDFLRAGAATAAATSAFGFNLAPAKAAVRELKIARTRERHSVCPYCAVGCGMVVHVGTTGGLNAAPTVVHIEGDPDSPINGGTLCPKGASAMQLQVNRHRIRGPRYRAPGSSTWQEVSWDWVMDQVAERVKASRDRTFVTRNEKGQLVNRTEGIAVFGSATMNNEDNYLLVKVSRALGVYYLDHQARI